MAKDKVMSVILIKLGLFQYPHESVPFSLSSPISCLFIIFSLFNVFFYFLKFDLGNGKIHLQFSCACSWSVQHSVAQRELSS